METLTADQFKQRYGGIATSQFDLAQKKEEQEASIFDSIKNDLNSRAQENVDILNQPREGPLGDVTAGVQMAANSAGGIGDVAGDVLHKIPVVGSLVKGASDLAKSGFNALTDKLGGTKFFQEAAAGLEPNNPLENSLKVASGGGQIAGTVLGAAYGAGLAQKGVTAAQKVPGAIARNAESPSFSMPTGQGAKSTIGKTMSNVSNRLPGAVSEALGTKQSWIDHNLAKALDLTPDDLAIIEASTGNQVGKWLADNNLIGSNKANTQGLIKGFFSENYQAVRNEIAKVTTAYSPKQIPRYADALTAIKSKVDGVVGLEKEARTVDRLLAKSEVSLLDVQIVKELLDEHFSLYKATGDVLQVREKQGLANVRQDIRAFIENQVAENTGADIRALNNNVATARALDKTITKRSPKGLTRSQVTWRDAAMGMGLTYFGSPLLGIAAVAVKKILTSPSVRLRFARYLDSLNDAQRFKISEDLSKGTVPPEVKNVVGPIEEPYVPNDKLPTIEMGEKPKSKDSLPTIKY